MRKLADAWRRRVVMTALTLGVIVLCFAAFGLTVGRATDPTGLEDEMARIRESAARRKRVVSAARAVREELHGRPVHEVDAAVMKRVAAIAAEPIPKEERGPTLPVPAILMGLVVVGGAIAVVTDRRAPRPA